MKKVTKAQVQRNVNRFIRERDKDKPCISCGNNKGNDAGHYISIGSCDALRFDYDNIHLQCASCNRFKGGNAVEYRLHLMHRIGVKRLDTLEKKFLMFKRTLHKWDQFTLTDINKKAIADYKELKKSFVL